MCAEESKELGGGAAGALLGVSLLLGGTAHAVVIWDNSPSESTWFAQSRSNIEANSLDRQWWAGRIWFEDGATVTGLDIYGDQTRGTAIQSATVHLWSTDSSGAFVSVQKLDTTISATPGEGTEVGIVRRYAEFAPVTLEAGRNYWIGMGIATMGTDEPTQFDQLVYQTLDAPGGIPYVLLTNTSGDVGTMIGTGPHPTTGQLFDFKLDMAFRVHGTEGASTPVPEPGTLLMLGTGLLGLAGLGRRKQIVFSGRECGPDAR